jgi:hypothetical protein
MQPHLCLDCAVCDLDDILTIESDLQVNVAGLGEEDDTDMEDNLDNRVKIAQDAHYDTLITWMTPHSLTLGTDNYLYKNQALVVVEDNSLRRGVTPGRTTLLVAAHARLHYSLRQRLRNLPNE